MWPKTSSADPQKRQVNNSKDVTPQLFPTKRGLLQHGAMTLLCLVIMMGATGCALPKKPGIAAPGARVPGAAISRAALDTVGTRYVYGGSTPDRGFDCSGLVTWAYAKNGLNVPRTARAQSDLGDTVGKRKLKLGDLVVFKTKSGLHTGIYTGNDKFVHSPRNGKSVREDNINDTYWQRCFISGRRHANVY